MLFFSLAPQRVFWYSVKDPIETGRYSDVKAFKSLFLCAAVLLLALTLYFRSQIHLVPLSASSVPAEPSVTTGPTGTEPEPTPIVKRDPEYFTISAIGDCTLTSHQNIGKNEKKSFAYKMGDNYGYPFSNTVSYFSDDELTIANLECTLSDARLQSLEQFYFLCPSAYAKILTAGGVDFVNTANNHSMDFGQRGVDDTCASLEAEGVPYGVDGQSQIITTPHGLRIGILCAYNRYFPDVDACVEAVKALRSEADYVICMFHWGKKELVYSPSQEQIDLAHACADAGADLVYGSHSHCLQPAEKYGESIILYGMGNWSFGGSTNPRDWDTAIAQIQICREGDGSVHNSALQFIPCAVSSRPALEGYTGDNYNDYCPTPYEKDTEDYARVMSKLDGSFDGGDIPVDYSNWYSSWG